MDPIKIIVVTAFCLALLWLGHELISLWEDER
jgi:hypothetical protein